MQNIFQTIRSILLQNLRNVTFFYIYCALNFLNGEGTGGTVTLNKEQVNFIAFNLNTLIFLTFKKMYT